jgi:ankyrin repeat protein
LFCLRWYGRPHQEQEQLEVLQLLINAGARLHVLNRQGHTALQLAVNNRHHKAALLLLGELRSSLNMQLHAVLDTWCPCWLEVQRMHSDPQGMHTGCAGTAAASRTNITTGHAARSILALRFALTASQASCL